MKANYTFYFFSWLKMSRICLGVFLVSISSCVVPFDFESNSYSKSLVVDGKINNGTANSYIELSFTSPVNSEETERINNASVNVISSTGTTIFYELNSPGRYEPTSEYEFAFGESYKLRINIPGQGSYDTEFIELQPSPPIDSIYSAYAELPSEELNENESGIQFFIDSDPAGGAQYYRYEWEETYLIYVPYASVFDFNYETNDFFRRDEPQRTCYGTNSSELIILANSINNQFNRVAEAPIHFVSTNVDYLRYRYSILVKQYAIEEEAYYYYRKLKESNESGGFLFDKQLGSLQGNVKSVVDAQEVVLGYFEVSGVSELRAFFNYEDLDSRIERPDFRYKCSLDNLISTSEDSIAYYMNRNERYRILNVPGPPDPVLMGFRECLTCDWYASTEKPEFWID